MFVVHSNWKKYHNRTQILTQKSPKQTKIPNQTIQNNTLAPNSPKRSKPTVHFLRLQYLKQVPHLHFCPLIALFTNLLQICCTLALTLQLFLCCTDATVQPMLKQGQDTCGMAALAECMFHISEVAWLDIELNWNVCISKKNLHYLVRAQRHEQFHLFAFWQSLTQVTWFFKFWSPRKNPTNLSHSLSADLFTWNLQHTKETLQSYCPSTKFQ